MEASQLLTVNTTVHLDRENRNKAEINATLYLKS